MPKRNISIFLQEEYDVQVLYLQKEDYTVQIQDNSEQEIGKTLLSWRLVVETAGGQIK